MKIAIPSNDNVTISKHFGRTKGFVIVEMENNEILSKTHITNDFTGHSQGLHHEHHDHNHHGHDHAHHSHDNIFKAIGDCSIVIAGGMGRRLYSDFEQRNMQVFITKEENIDTALQAYINGNLDNNSDICCSH